MGLPSVWSGTTYASHPIARYERNEEIYFQMVVELMFIQERLYGPRDVLLPVNHDLGDGRIKYVSGWPTRRNIAHLGWL